MNHIRVLLVDDHPVVRAGLRAMLTEFEGISVAAELSGINEQSLRLYERQGLLAPARSKGGTRRYSADDLTRVQRISELVAAGVNLAGIARIIELEDRNDFLDERNAALEDDNAALDTAKTRRKSAGRRVHP